MKEVVRGLRADDTHLKDLVCFDHTSYHSRRQHLAVRDAVYSFGNPVIRYDSRPHNNVGGECGSPLPHISY